MLPVNTETVDNRKNPEIFFRLFFSSAALPAVVQKRKAVKRAVSKHMTTQRCSLKPQ
jgi:hypothetical protein